ncbi:hypothetical protein, partial [Sphingobacterium deserti]|uniref:hypothetical protein n=1 Tax=Sphingobacterium deserti TaxID=1229276 RepID=UPI0019D3E299
LVPFALQKERHVLAKDGRDVGWTIRLKDHTTLQKYLPCRGMRRKGYGMDNPILKRTTTLRAATYPVLRD